MKKVTSGIIAIIILGVGWYFLADRNYTFFGASEFSKFASSTVTSLQNDGSQISMPEPLKRLTGLSSPLTDSGVIYWTNQNRSQNGGFAALTENQTLDKEAQAKVADMFKQQYFEHVNPQGNGPDYLAKTYGYAYVSIGENLALGDFNGDQDLLTAWMNSPGHRANILNTHYKEIGVAAQEGKFNGQEVWLAVQEFGQPASDCPSVDTGLKDQIDLLQTQVDQKQAQLIEEKQNLDSQNPQNQSQDSAYNEEVASYNLDVGSYNNLVDQLKQYINSYDAEVTAFNACLKS